MLGPVIIEIAVLAFLTVVILIVRQMRAMRHHKRRSARYERRRIVERNWWAMQWVVGGRQAKRLTDQRE